MKEFWNFIQMVFMAVGGWLGWFMGGCDGLLYALIAFVVIDYLTGVMCAFADHTLSSEVGFRGICRNVLIFIYISTNLPFGILTMKGFFDSIPTELDEAAMIDGAFDDMLTAKRPAPVSSSRVSGMMPRSRLLIVSKSVFASVTCDTPDSLV